MAIKFPQVNIATSTVNRILNVADGLGMMHTPAQMPDVPGGTEQLGAAVETGATAPVPELELSDPLAGTVGRGDNLIDEL